MLLFAGSSRAADTNSLETAEQAASEWVKLRVETARLDQEWKTQRELLESLVASATAQAASLEEKRDLVRAQTAKDREEIATLRTKKEAAADDVRVIETRLKSITTELLALRPQLPPRLSAALEMSYRSLQSSELSPAERMQWTMTVLNRCAQFNREVTCGEEVLQLDERGARAFEVIYWGLSHGYALDRSGNKAWIGRTGGDGWQWELRPDAAPHVGQLISIYHDRADPEFVPVPAKLDPPANPAR